MGLFDDAIRDHLELKRRRGADLQEIAQIERDALRRPDGVEEVEPDYEPSEHEPALGPQDAQIQLPDPSGAWEHGDGPAHGDQGSQETTEFAAGVTAGGRSSGSRDDAYDREPESDRVGADGARADDFEWELPRTRSAGR